ncbi:MAG: type II toxin-antitoxin system prevent-host-death family antitoxin [Sulfuricaulis sp.]|nr:type II toxin-antitoxin system prevent-host-death family antitoxin [Sulfuricaulis sp.]
MGKINIHNAKTNLSRLIEKAAKGEEVVISRAGEPVARLVPIKTAAARRRKGLLKKKIKIRPGFYKPLPEEVIAAFEGKPAK